MTARAATHPYDCPPTCPDCRVEEEFRDLCDRLECSDPQWVDGLVACGECDRCLYVPGGVS